MLFNQWAWCSDSIRWLNSLVDQGHRLDRSGDRHSPGSLPPSGYCWVCHSTGWLPHKKRGPGPRNFRRYFRYRFRRFWGS